MTGDDTGWSFASAREPARFAAAQENSGPADVEHAFQPPATLCGIQLLDALAGGAKIAIWINGPAQHVAGYANADRITRGAGAVRTWLSTRGHIGIARVAGPSGEFLVVLPERDPPAIAFAANRRPDAGGSV